MRATLVVGIASLLAVLTAGPIQAEKRVALVIGNGAYAHAQRLPNPRNDAEDVAGSLRRSGFETIVGTDLDKAGMDDAFVRFARSARAADVALFYYSGHAMQFAGSNYLIPVDANLTDEADLRRMARVDDVVADLQQSKALRILVLDSCRDNPLAEQLRRSIGRTRAASIQRGLARIESPEGMIVAYATQAGRTADDGNGRNSPYTAAFLRHIEEKEEIGTIFRRVSADVYEATRKKQLPELSLSLIGEFYLNGRLQAAVAPPAIDRCAAASEHWRSAEAIRTIAAYEDHLARFSDCTFAGLARHRLDELKKAQVAAVAPAARPAAVIAAAFRASGTIAERPVDVGSVVRKGDLLARIDAAAFSAEVERAQSQVLAAQAAVSRATAEEARSRKLAAGGMLSAADYDRAKSALEQSKAQLAALQAQLTFAREQLLHTRLLAAIDGVVTAVGVEVGTMVRAGDTVVEIRGTAK